MHKRLLRTAGLAGLIFSLQALSAPYVYFVQELKALECCAKNCGPLEVLAPTRCRCCQLSSAADSTAVTPAKLYVAPSLSDGAVVHVAASAPALAPPIAGHPTKLTRAAPVFLLDQTLRL